MHSDAFEHKRLLIVGHPLENQVGAHLRRAAAALGIEAQIVDIRAAYSNSRLSNWVHRKLRDNRAPNMSSFGRAVLALAEQFAPHWCLVSGVAPVDAETLHGLRARGIRTLNFSTDDPWNPNFSSKWILETFARYDIVFTPRRDCIDQFRQQGCSQVEYMPFAYDPLVHAPATAKERAKSSFSADVVFIGAADDDRLPFAEALIDSGLDVVLFGLYWERFARTKSRARGTLLPKDIRVVLAESKVSVCLVRRRNRDSHVMRSYEEPAMRSCMAFERTEDHRLLFDSPLLAGASFGDPKELAHLVTALCRDEGRREAIREQQHAAVTGGQNTYTDRLAAMLRRVPPQR